MTYVLIFFLSLTVTIFSLPYVISVLKKLGIVDKPGGRKTHTEPIPRMGGIVIFFVTFMVLISFISDINIIRLFFLPSQLLLLCGMIDDWKGLSWKTKFILQFAAAGLAVALLGPMFDTISLLSIVIAAPWSYILLTVFIVGAINSINLMDGMDGLVTGFSLIVFFMIFWLAYMSGNFVLLVLCSALVGSTLGFLKYNAHPARIFLGDTGSLLLGYFIVLTGLLISPAFKGERNLSLTFPLILLGLPLIDTLKVMAIRIWNSKSPFLPDRNHFHHVLIGNNISHKYAVFILQIISFLFIMIAYDYMAVSKLYSVIAFAALSSVLIFMKPIVQRAVSSESLRQRIKDIVFRMPPAYIRLYKNFMTPLSIFAALILVTFLIPGRSDLSGQTTLMLISALAVLFIISQYQFIRSGVFSQTYVLINLLIFSTIAGLSSPLLNSFSVSPDIGKLIVRFSNLFLFLFIVFFLLTRERLFGQRPSILSGMDLIILVLIFLTTVVQNFVQLSGMNYLGIHLVIGFSIYLWYKIIINWKKEAGMFLFYMSFALPLASLVSMSVV